MEPTKEQLAAMGLYAPPPPPPLPDSGGIPPILSASPALPSSSLGDKIDPGMKIPADKMNSAAILGGHPEEVPQDEMHQAGKDAYHESIPKISAMPGSADYYRQRQSQLDFKQAHPWGDEVSEHPGILGKIGHVAAKIGNIAGDAIIPGVMQNIPGTDLHNEVERAQNEHGITQGVENAGREATTAETQEATREAPAKLRIEQQKEEDTRNPKTGKTPEEQAFASLTGQLNPDTQKPYTPIEAFQKVKQTAQDVKPTPAEKKNDFEQFYDDYLKDNKFPDTAHNRLLAREKYAAAGQTPQRDPRQLAIGPDGKVIELKPGVTVPQGTETVSGNLKPKEPTADEKRRGDLSDNMTENLNQLEDVLKRRPELFGPIAGRLTGLKETIGTSDPDVAALKTIQEQMGMAMVGAHAMRNAQHVATAANSVVNSFHNSPEAISSAIKAARNSLKTFQDDAHKEGKPASTPAGNGPTAGTVESGYRFKGGDPAKKENWEKVK